MNIFKIYELSDAISSAAADAGKLAEKEHSAEIRPQHLLETLISKDCQLLERTSRMLNSKSLLAFEKNHETVLARLQESSKGLKAGQHSSPVLSDAAEKLLHDAEVISLFRNCPLSEENLIEAILLESYLSPKNGDLDAVGYALGLRFAPGAGAGGGEDTPWPASFPPGGAPVDEFSFPDEPDSVFYDLPAGKIQTRLTKTYTKRQMQILAEKKPGSKAALDYLNVQYTSLVQDYIRAKVYIGLMAANLGDCRKSAEDAASEFFSGKLSEGDIYRKYVAFSKSRPEALFRSYIVCSANHFVKDFIARKVNEGRRFVKPSPDLDPLDIIPSRKPGPASLAGMSENRKIISTILQDFLAELLFPSPLLAKSESKVYFYIIYERVITPHIYNYEEPTFSKMAQKLSMITGKSWKTYDITGRHLTVMSKLRQKLKKALDN